MKLILIIILIGVIMIIAYSISDQYKEKFDFYNNLKKFLQEFKINISFKQSKITEFIKSIKAKKQFKLFLNSYKTYLDTGNLNLEQINILSDEEKNQLKNIVSNIGAYDVKNEICQVETFLLEIDEKLKIAEEDKKKLSPMIIKLSLLFAIGLAILLI